MKLSLKTLAQTTIYIKKDSAVKNPVFFHHLPSVRLCPLFLAKFDIYIYIYVTLELATSKSVTRNIKAKKYAT